MAGSGLVMLGHVHIVLAKSYHYSWQHFPFKLCQRLNRQFVGSKQTIRCACFCKCVCVCVVESVPNDSAGEEPAPFEGTDSSHKAGCAYIPRVIVLTKPANDQNARRGRINCSHSLATGQGRVGKGVVRPEWLPAPCLHKIFVQTFLRSVSWFLYIISVQFFSFFVDIRANFSEIRITSQYATCKATWTESPSYVHLFNYSPNICSIWSQVSVCLCNLLLDK